MLLCLLYAVSEMYIWSTQEEEEENQVSETSPHTYNTALTGVEHP